MKHISLLAVVLVSLLTGCTTPKPGQVLDPSVVDHLRVGQKRNDVLALIGQPNKTDLGKLTVRDVYWVLNGQKRFESSAQPSISLLTIIYNHKDILLKSHYSQNDLREFHAGRRYSSEAELPTANKNIKIEPRITKTSDLTEWFGKPTYTTLDMVGNLTFVWGFKLENRKDDVENWALQVSVDDSEVVVAYFMHRFEDYFKPLRQR